MAKLSPARRTLLIICLILAFLGLDEERDAKYLLVAAVGLVFLLVGDASGHGMAAGLLMAISDTTLHIALETDPSPLAEIFWCSTRTASQKL